MFASATSEGQRRAFWHTNQQKKKDSKGSEDGGLAGDVPPGGGGVLKSKREGVRRSPGKTEGGENVRHRVRKREGEGQGGGGGEDEEGGRTEERGERSRALSCRPGSQIRRGLKRGVDCV